MESSARSNCVDFDDYDAVIDLAGELDRKGEINVWDGGRLVVRFPPRQPSP
jgi:hypothetical protein